MARVPRRSQVPALAWLINPAALESATTVEELKQQIAQLTDAGVPTSQIFRVFDLADWYRRILS